MRIKTGCKGLTAWLALVMGAAWAAAPADWPMWGYDAARSGKTHVELPEALHTHWIRQMPPPRRAWPAQHDDRDKLEFDLSYAPIVMGDMIYVSSMVRDRVTAYRIEDGAEVWRFYADGPMRLAPAGWDGRIYAVSDDGYLYCLDALTGALQWRFDGAPAGHRVLGNERVIRMWPARGAPVIKDGTVYFAAGIWPFLGTFLYALDAETGELEWENSGHATEWQRQPHGGAYAFAGLAPQGYLAASTNHLVVSGGRALPGVFDRRDGTLLHSNITGKEVGGYRVRIDGDTYENHGRRYRLDTGSGQGRAELECAMLTNRVATIRHHLDGEPFEYLAAHDRLFVVTRKGTLYAFGAGPRETITHAYEPTPPQERSDATGRRARAILENSGTFAGYALFLGVGNGDLIEQIAVRSDLHIVGIDPDTETIDALRRRFDKAGLYGTRIALVPGKPGKTMYPKYISSLIVMEDPSVIGHAPDTEFLEFVYERLRPYHGMAFLSINHATRQAYDRAITHFNPDAGWAAITDDALILAREGPLPDTGQWTHQYADAANTTHSVDDRVRPPFGPLWFGGPNHDNILPRHSQGPVPHVAGGRIILPGVETLSARCVFTGRQLWEREFPSIGHPFTNLELETKWADGESVYMTNLPGANQLGSPYVSLADAIYLRYRGKVLRLDPDTGETLDTFDLQSEDPEGFSGGHISVSGDVLLVTADPQIFDEGRIGGENVNGLSSDRLLAFDRHTGEPLWTKEADIGFRHNAIVSGGDRVFVIDSLNEPAMNHLERRGMRPDEEPVLMGLDITSGSEIWRVSDGVFGTWLGYSAKHDVLVQGGRGAGKRAAPGEAYERSHAYRGKDGERLWRSERDTAHLALAGDWLIPGHPVYGWALDLRTGEPIRKAHALTGEPVEWRYWRTYGCNTFNTSTHLLLFRSGAAGFTDLKHHGGTGTLGGFRAGCSNNMMPADGVLSVPDYTRTCTCSYQNQTSIGLIHMPEMEMWTANKPPDAVGRWNLNAPTGTIARIGINFGAPGDRRAENGTLWTPYPSTDAPAPDYTVRLAGMRFSETPVRVHAASASSGSAAHTLDGNQNTRWSIRSDRQGRFDEWLRYDLNEATTLDQIALAWSGPAGTKLHVDTSEDGTIWHTVLEIEDAGNGTDEPTVYAFDPVPARHVRVTFLQHDRERRSRLNVFETRIGDLPDPEAYVYFLPLEDMYRKNALRIDGANGLNWVAASGVYNLRTFELDRLQGGGARHTVTLHFAEPYDLQEGERVFDIYLQDNKVVAAFDPVKVAGGADRAVTHTFTGVRIGEQPAVLGRVFSAIRRSEPEPADDGVLRLAFKPANDSKYPPILNGLEIIRE